MLFISAVLRAWCIRGKTYIPSLARGCPKAPYPLSQPGNKFLVVSNKCVYILYILRLVAGEEPSRVTSMYAAQRQERLHVRCRLKHMCISDIIHAFNIDTFVIIQYKCSTIYFSTKHV